MRKNNKFKYLTIKGLKKLYTLQRVYAALKSIYEELLMKWETTYVILYNQDKHFIYTILSHYYSLKF